jgi:hypothetical protein
MAALAKAGEYLIADRAGRRRHFIDRYFGAD